MRFNIKTNQNDNMDITVIIPVYNAEKRIERCINSVLNHLPQASLIIINDGSIDNTKNLLERHYSKYENIKIIHKSNGGVSSARNVGLENTKTKYITFLDSDDEFNEGIQDFVNKFLKTKADLTIGGYKRISKKESLSIPNDRVWDLKDYLIDIDAREDYIHLQYPWGKFYSQEIINENNIRFNEEVNHGEDTLFVFEYLKHVKNIRFINEIVYNYYDVENSLSKRGDYKVFLNYNQINDKILDLYKANKIEVNKDLFYLRTNAQTITIFTVIFRDKSLSRKDRLSIIKDRLDDERTIESFKNYNNFTFQERVVRRFIINKRIKSLYYIFKLKNMIKYKWLNKSTQ